MNDEINEETFDEGLLDRIVDTIAGKSSKASQHATNLKAFFLGDKDAIGDPEQAENLRKFERNIHRIKEKFDKLIEELGDDLVDAVGVPDEGPFKDVVDEFDTAVSTLRDAIDKIAVKADSVDDALPPAKSSVGRFSREEYENKKDNKQQEPAAEPEDVGAAAPEAAEDPDPFSDWRESNKDIWEEEPEIDPIELPPNPEHERYWDEAEQARSPDLSESTEQTLKTWQKIIS